MKTIIKYSKLFQIGLLLTFFLPFFPQGCEPKNAEVAPKVDSTIVVVDTLRHDSSDLTQGNKQADTIKTAAFENTAHNNDKSEVTNDDSELSIRFSKKSTILKFLLRPNNNYTGIASLIDCFSLLETGYGLGMAFMLWLIALIVKFKDYNNIFVLLNIVGLIIMFGTHSIVSEQRLWGFWVCVIWSVAMIVYDLIILLKIRKERVRTGD